MRRSLSNGGWKYRGAVRAILLIRSCLRASSACSFSHCAWTRWPIATRRATLSGESSRRRRTKPSFSYFEHKRIDAPEPGNGKLPPCGATLRSQGDRLDRYRRFLLNAALPRSIARSTFDVWLSKQPFHRSDRLEL